MIVGIELEEPEVKCEEQRTSPPSYLKNDFLFRCSETYICSGRKRGVYGISLQC